jgi:hypothetical protein
VTQGVAEDEADEIHADAAARKGGNEELNPCASLRAMTFLGRGMELAELGLPPVPGSAGASGPASTNQPIEVQPCVPSP